MYPVHSQPAGAGHGVFGTPCDAGDLGAVSHHSEEVERGCFFPVAGESVEASRLQAVVRGARAAGYWKESWLGTLCRRGGKDVVNAVS